jgi:uncharacterized membrane protein
MNDYLDRLSARLKGMPDSDRSELITEIRSHIYESYMEETSGDEIGRILAVLKRLGDPADVVSSRMPQAVKRLGRGKKAPFYILAAILIALFGVPLGLGAAAALVGLMAGLLGLLIGYYATAISFVVAGFCTSALSLVAIFAPEIIYRINDAAGTDVIQFGLFQHDPQLGGLLGLIVALIMAGLGLLMLWSGKYMWRGFRFFALLVAQKVRSIFSRLAQPGS